MVFDRDYDKDQPTPPESRSIFDGAPPFFGKHGFGDMVSTLHKANFTREEAPQHCHTALGMVLAMRGDACDLY